MSGQAKRSRVRAAIRHREQVARLIAIATDPECESLHCGACAGSGDDEVDEHEIGCEVCGGSGSGLDALARAILAGQTFDVALARAYGERLISEGEHASATWAVFVDWCRDQGLGPESRSPCTACTPVEFTTGPQSMTETIASMMTMLGTSGDGGGEWSVSVSVSSCTCHETTRGWPGNLAAAWARGPGRVTCGECKGRGRQTLSITLTTPIAGVHQTFAAGDQCCPACEGSGLIEGPRPQPGDAQIRMGRRLLAALEGQPSECQRCIGPSTTIEGATENVRRIAAETDGPVAVPTHPEAIARLRHTRFGESHESCLEWIAARYDATFMVNRSPQCCRGTGHNLAGVLPPTEWPAVVRRRAIDGYRVASPDEPQHVDANRQRIVDSGRDIATVRPRDPHRLVDTRSVPRGQHRALESADMVAASNRCTTNVSVVNGDSIALWAPVSMLWRHPSPTHEQRRNLCPRWWRGEQRQPPGWSVDFASFVSTWDGQFTIATGTDLDRVGQGVQLYRRVDETDAELRARVTERIREVAGIEGAVRMALDAPREPGE